jgi:uncharacterized protein YwqG
MENLFKSAGLPFETYRLETLKAQGGTSLLEHLQILVERHPEGAMLVAKSVGNVLLEKGFANEMIVALEVQLKFMIEDQRWFALVVSTINPDVKVPYDRPVVLEPPSQYNFIGFDNATPDDFEQAFKTVGLEHHWPVFKELLKPEIRIQLTRIEEDELPVGVSKIGGQPDLPVSMAWSCTLVGEPLSFLAQLNLAELVVDAADFGLPPSGMLYFFYSGWQDGWGHSPEDADKFKCFFLGNVPPLVRMAFPDELYEGIFPACTLTFQPAFGLPYYEYDAVKTHLHRQEIHPYIDVSSHRASNPSKLFGCPNCIQGPYMEQTCALATHGYIQSDLNNPEIKAMIEEEKHKWMLLFQLSSENAAEMCWGDVGLLYFWIKKEDFAQRHFDRVWMILECG